jgi:hypothetical protein
MAALFRFNFGKFNPICHHRWAVRIGSCTRDRCVGRVKSFAQKFSDSENRDHGMKRFVMDNDLPNRHKGVSYVIAKKSSPFSVLDLFF